MHKHKMKILLTAILLVLCFIWGVSAANKTKFFSRRAGQGVIVSDQADTTGNIWFVDSGSANASDAAGKGMNPDYPFATIDYAVGNCTANNGDWIIVMPGHTETLSSAAAINFDVAGIKVIGLGTGRSRPQISFDSGASVVTCVKVDAANVKLENLVFDFSGMTPFVGAGAGKDAGDTAGVSVFTSATDLEISNCEFIVSGDFGKVSGALYLTGGTRTWVHDSVFRSGVSDTSPGENSGVSGAVVIGSGVYNVEIGPNVQIEAYSAGADNGLIHAEDSRISGFTLHDSILKQKNSGASCWNFSTAGLASDVKITNVWTFIEGLSGVSKSQLHNTKQAPPYDDNE